MKGKLTITRNSNYEINIELEDKNSGIRVVNIAIQPEQFALALTNLGYQDCEFKMAKSNNIGKIKETKTELIPVDEDIYKNFEIMRELVKPYEIDGWKASEYELRGHNFHRRKDKNYLMSFERYMDENKESKVDDPDPN